MKSYEYLKNVADRDECVRKAPKERIRYGKE